MMIDFVSEFIIDSIVFSFFMVVCTAFSPLLSRDGSLLFQNKRDILNTILLTRITVQWGSKHYIQLLGNDAMSRQQSE